MDEDVDVEERKPFNDESATAQEEQYVPDEILELSGGNGRVWMVKVPKYLMERWLQVTGGNIHLATMRVYQEDHEPSPNRILLFLPDAPELENGKAVYDTSGISKQYTLDIVNGDVTNQYVVSERDLEPAIGRAKSTHLLGQIQHECNVQNTFNSSFRETIRARARAALPKKAIVRLDKDNLAGGQGALNKLSSGTAAAPSMENLVQPTGRKTGKDFERFARAPRNEVLDMIFRLFQEKSAWSFKDLRMKTEQPAEWLKTCLNGVAMLHRSGELNGQYTLMENFTSGGPPAKSEYDDTTMASAKMEDEDDDDDDDNDDDDDDMEEVQ